MLIADRISYQYPGSDAPVWGGGVSLAAEPGKLTAIVGESGSGKSTLLACLAGVLTALSGEVSVDRRILTGRSRDTGGPVRTLVLQNSAMFEKLTVCQNVALAWGWPSRKTQDAANKHLADLRLGDLGDKLPSQLSLGQRQRAAIAAAVALRPRVLLADEPTGSLDAQNAQSVADLLTAIAREGRIVIVGTHDAGMMRAADVVYDMAALRSGDAA